MNTLIELLYGQLRRLNAGMAVRTRLRTGKTTQVCTSCDNNIKVCAYGCNPLSPDCSGVQVVPC